MMTTFSASPKLAASPRLAGKVALVTGGSRGIGAAIARRLAADGADIALTYARNADKAAAVVGEIEQLNQRGVAIAADAVDAATATASVERTVAELGRIDILVNNAGIFIARPLDDYSLADIDQTLSVNIRAVFLASQAAARHMAAGGRIISLGSSLAERVPRAQATLYALSKSALIGMTKGLARDLGPRGITVNVVHPGSADTDMNPADGPQAEGQRALLATGKYGAPADIASLVAYLAGAESAFITGAGIAIDGGFTA
jgi:NAD(P)-dependent dehydrogenase (short-subunit alcohol dehydrogenase family)